MSPDYVLAYSELARRVSTALAYFEAEREYFAREELRAAMKVIARIENPILVIDGNRPT